MKPEQYAAKILAAAAVLASSATIAQTPDGALPPPPTGVAPAQTRPASPPASTTAPPAPAAAAPAGVESVRAGALELTPVKAIARVSRQRNQTCIDAVVSFRVHNTGPADMRVTLFTAGLAAVDALGVDLFGRADFLRTTGIVDSKMPQAQWMRFLNESKSQMSVISPGQTINVQIQPANAHGKRCIEDRNGDFLSSHRPASYTLSGSLGVSDLTDKSEVRGFSFSDVPLDVIAN
jgi:hypothetical protein